MIFDTEVSPKKLERLCESWSRQEIKEGLEYFSARAKEDSFHYRQVRVLIEELETRNSLGS